MGYVSSSKFFTYTNIGYRVANGDLDRWACSRQSAYNLTCECIFLLGDPILGCDKSCNTVSGSIPQRHIRHR